MRPPPAGSDTLAAPCPLSDDHDLSGFDCGNADLNDWLHERARDSESRTARTYVVCARARVAAYYCLAAGAVVRQDMPSARLRRNTPAGVPVIVIGRLAVDRRFHGRSIGAGMLKDAILRAIEASRTVGVRTIIVHAIDESAARFYERYGFLRSPLDERTLVLPIETAIAALPKD